MYNSLWLVQDDSTELQRQLACSIQSRDTLQQQLGSKGRELQAAKHKIAGLEWQLGTACRDLSTQLGKTKV